MLNDDPVAIVGVSVPKVGRHIPDETSMSLVIKAVKGALEDAGITKEEVNGAIIYWPGPGGAMNEGSANWAQMFGHKLNWVIQGHVDAMGIIAVQNAAAAIQAGLCETVVIGGALAGGKAPSGFAGSKIQETPMEFTVPFGTNPMSTFALVATDHMHRFGTKPEHLAEVAATIRNHGHVNPEATMYGRGPYTIQDVLDSRMVCSPLHLLDCCLNAQGGAAIVVTSGKRARELRRDPVYVLGAGNELEYGFWAHPYSYDDVGRLGAGGAKRAFELAGLTPDDVDVLCLYDPTSFDVIHQIEFLGFCKEGEGGPFVENGALGLHGRLPTNLDGGLLAHCWAGFVQMHLRVIEGVRQLRGKCDVRQVKDAKIALCTNAGSAASHHHTLMLGK